MLARFATITLRAASRDTLRMPPRVSPCHAVDYRLPMIAIAAGGEAIFSMAALIRPLQFVIAIYGLISAATTGGSFIECCYLCRFQVFRFRDHVYFMLCARRRCRTMGPSPPMPATRRGYRATEIGGGRAYAAPD